MVIVVTKPEILWLAKDPHLHARLRALIVDLSVYRVKWEVGRSVLDIEGEILDHKSLLEGTKQEPFELKRIEHKEVVIKRPATTRKLPATLEEQPHWTMFFDGGSASRLGTGGWLLFNPGG